MRIHFVVLFLLIAVGLISLSRQVYAVDQKTADTVMNKYLATMKDAESEGQSLGNVIADLNGDSKAEIVLLWANMGPTYSSNFLTVFTDTGKGYAVAGSFPLTGEADKVSVKNGVILVDQKVAAKNDPICCPSIVKLGKYRWQPAMKKILEVK